MADDAAIARLAARQQRVVSSEQLSGAGFTWNAIAHRLEHGVLQRLWRGIYLVGRGSPTKPRWRWAPSSRAVRGS